MATIRHHARIDRAPDDVWRVVADAGAISEWFPAIEQSSADGGVRDCTLVNGARLREQIVTSDDELRRFQYRIVDGDMPLESTSTPSMSSPTATGRRSSTRPICCPTTPSSRWTA